jgi:protein-tyrosine-phosphatase
MNRRYSLGIWGLALGYFIFYLPYCALIKAITTGLWQGPVSGFELLPATVIATAVVVLVIITAMGWWKYPRRVQLFGINIPCPTWPTFLSGVCMATIMATTTLAFSFGGASIVFMLILLRAGVLVLGPIVDASLNRRVRWFSWTAMGISLIACVVALADVSNYTLSLIAVVDIAAYLASYFFRFRLMTRLAKSDDQDNTIRYFVEEQMTAAPLLLLVLAFLAWTGSGEIMGRFQRGFTSLLEGHIVVPTLLIGAFYAALCVCTTFIFLDCRENTFCIPIHSGSSLLSGIVASSVLAYLYHQPSTSSAQYASAGLIMIAILVLSPLHHLRLYLARIERVLRSDRKEMRDPWYIGQLQRVFLFVCSGNTSRSPIAQAICMTEMVRRLNIPLEALAESKVQVMSAGLSAKPGTPMAPEAQLALRQLGVPAFLHVAQQLTAEMVEQAGVIFCMTENQRQAIIDRVPEAAARVRCLDPSGDIEDPTGTGPEALLNCARRIQSLVRQRLDRIGLAQA